MSYLISVIVPVYNNEKYLKQALDSIVNQTLGIENIEVIIIDDASTDSTYKIAKEYESKYPSFKVLQHDVNKGPGPGRNLGLEHATADYVTFLDGDDYISLNAYERALEIFKSDEEADLVIFKWEEFDDENGIWNMRELSKESLREDKVITDINDCPEMIFATYAYIKVYSKRLAKYLKFPPRTYEDVCPSARVMIHAKKIYVSSDITVYYRQYTDSSSKDTTYQNYLNLLIAAKQVIDLRDENPKYYDLLSFLALRITYWPINHLCLRGYVNIDDGKRVFEKLKEYLPYFTPELIKRYQENFPNYLQASPDAMWDIGKMEYYDYLIKHRYEREIENLEQHVQNLEHDIYLKGENIDSLNKEKAKLIEDNDSLKAKNKKLKDKNKEILSSKSWKMTGPLRKIKRKL